MEVVDAVSYEVEYGRHVGGHERDERVGEVRHGCGCCCCCCKKNKRDEEENKGKQTRLDATLCLLYVTDASTTTSAGAKRTQ